MRIYTISGLGVDFRVFNYISFPCEHVHLDWLEPHDSDSLESYAKRMSENIDTSKPFILLGVSFGGMVATEISKLISPTHLILVSSVAYSKELPTLYTSSFAQFVTPKLPEKLLHIPSKVAHPLFGTKHTELLDEILKDIDPHFLKWAISAISNWDQKDEIISHMRIHGGSDYIIPKRNADLFFEKGGHLIIVDYAKEISEFLFKLLEK